MTVRELVIGPDKAIEVAISRQISLYSLQLRFRCFKRPELDAKDVADQGLHVDLHFEQSDGHSLRSHLCYDVLHYFYCRRMGDLLCEHS